MEDVGYLFVLNALLFGLGFVGTQADGIGGAIIRLIIGLLTMFNILAALVAFGYVVQA